MNYYLIVAFRSANERHFRRAKGYTNVRPILTRSVYERQPISPGSRLGLESHRRRLSPPPPYKTASYLELEPFGIEVCSKTRREAVSAWSI